MLSEGKHISMTLGVFYTIVGAAVAFGGWMTYVQLSILTIRSDVLDIKTNVQTLTNALIGNRTDNGKYTRISTTTNFDP